MARRTVLLAGVLGLVALAAPGGARAQGPALAELVRTLGSGDAAARERAARSLGELGPGAAAAVDDLVARLGDDDAYVGGAAADALARIGEAAVPRLARALGDGRAVVRWGAAIALGRVGGTAAPAVAELVRALADGDDNVRYCAAVALGSVGPAAAPAAPALTEALADRDEDVRRAADDALGRVARGGARPPGDWRSAVAALDRLTPALMSELHVPGVSIAVVADRRLVWSKSWGVADVRSGRAVSAETRFEACSMSKPAFAWVALKLAEEGRLDLDRPLAELLPEELPPAQPEKARITARMVLCHTSGLPNWRKGDEERGGPLPVLFEPGSRFGYSGEGYFYLQRVVERTTGEPLDALARRMLFAPAGLAHTSYAWSEDLDAALAAGHAADGKFLQKTRYRHPNAAYSLYTTADDYARFVAAIMGDGGPAGWALSRRSVEAMLGHAVAVASRDPIERPGAARGTAVFWGLGWSVNATPSGDIAHHGGANRSGFRCFSQFCPGRGSAIVIMTNGLSGGELWTRLISRVGDL